MLAGLDTGCWRMLSTLFGSLFMVASALRVAAIINFVARFKE